MCRAISPAPERSLKNKRSLLLGIVVSDQSSPFSTAVLLGVGDALRNTEYVPVFVNCDDDPAKERYQISFLLSRGVDGLIVNTTSYENPFLVNLEARGVPVVLCDRYIKGHTFDIVTTDHDSTIRQLLAHLKEQGYGLPALFSQRWDNNSVRLQRRQAFAAGAEALFGLRPARHPYMRWTDRTRAVPCVPEDLNGPLLHPGSGPPSCGL